MWRCKDCGKIFDEPDAHECCGVFREDTRFEYIEEPKVTKLCVIPWQFGNKAPCSDVYLVCSASENFVKVDIAGLDGSFLSGASDIYAYVELKDLPVPWEQISMPE